MSSVRERILARLEERDCGYETPCWVWLGATIGGGYGVIRVGGRDGKLLTTHRALYEALEGPVPARLVLDHLCRNPPCANPAHLEPVTHRENIIRGMVLKTHCPQNHPYDEANTYVDPDGARRCRTCNRDRARARKAA